MNMKTVLGIAAAIALCGCGRANQQGSYVSATDNGGTPVTLVGCLVPGGVGSMGSTASTTGTSGTAASGYTLIDVTSTSAAPAPPASGVSGSSGTSGTAAKPTVDTTTPRSYTLVGGKQDDLQKYQNSQVEISGLVIPSTDSGAGAPGSGVPDVGAASAPAGTPPTNVERVRVEKVRQLEPSCSGYSTR